MSKGITKVQKDKQTKQCGQCHWAGLVDVLTQGIHTSWVCPKCGAEHVALLPATPK